jgi:hypothetical protein
MKDERDSDSLSDLSPDDGHADAARPWRVPIVTRVSLAQTLFGPGSPTDISTTGAVSS